MFLSKLTPVKDARIVIDKIEVKPDIEKISLENAYNRVLAENITALLDSPSFDKSAMDGYAVKAEDTFGFSQTNPTYLKVVDRIGAGDTSKVILKNGEAVKIATGAPIPKGADAVVMEEYTYEKNDNLEVSTTLTPGENVAPLGEDFKQGNKLLKAGKFLSPHDIGLISSAGYDTVNVFNKPKIGVITTGNELVMSKSEIEGAKIINSNYYTLKALVESTNAIPDVTHCVDDAKKVEEKIEKFLKSCDAIITTGGTAISKGDVVVNVVDKMGEVLIHGVAVKPGKPVGFGVINKTPIFMLSGYPVASMVQFDIFVRNSLLKMQNIHREPPIIKKRASKKIASGLGRTEYIRAKVDGDSVSPLKIKGSGIIRSMVESNCYIIIKENVEGINEGEECDVLLYDSLKV